MSPRRFGSAQDGRDVAPNPHRAVGETFTAGPERHERHPHSSLQLALRMTCVATVKIHSTLCLWLNASVQVIEKRHHYKIYKSTYLWCHLDQNGVFGRGGPNYHVWTRTVCCSIFPLNPLLCIFCEPTLHYVYTYCQWDQAAPTLILICITKTLKHELPVGDTIAQARIRCAYGGQYSLERDRAGELCE